MRLVGVAKLKTVGKVDFLFAGWECQGHSRAGLGQGLDDPRSKLFYELVRIVNTFQTDTSPSVGYVFENVVSRNDPRPKV